MIRAVSYTHLDAQIIPIIALSADDTLEDVRKCKEAGMNAHIAKPVEPQKDVYKRQMCNLSQGIKEDGIAIGEAGRIMKMYKNGFTAEQIASATDKDIDCLLYTSRCV